MRKFNSPNDVNHKLTVLLIIGHNCEQTEQQLDWHNVTILLGETMTSRSASFYLMLTGLVVPFFAKGKQLYIYIYINISLCIHIIVKPLPETIGIQLSSKLLCGLSVCGIRSCAIATIRRREEYYYSITDPVIPYTQEYSSALILRHFR